MPWKKNHIVTVASAIAKVRRAIEIDPDINDPESRLDTLDDVTTTLADTLAPLNPGFDRGRFIAVAEGRADHPRPNTHQNQHPTRGSDHA